eukprot:4263682-Amphidinium_carterae.2
MLVFMQVADEKHVIEWEPPPPECGTLIHTYLQMFLQGGSDSPIGLNRGRKVLFGLRKLRSEDMFWDGGDGYWLDL